MSQIKSLTIGPWREGWRGREEEEGLDTKAHGLDDRGTCGTWGRIG